MPLLHRHRDPNTIVVSDPVTTTHHRPGSALETAGDQAANRELRLEVPVETLVPLQPESAVDTTSPAANLASRVNIVPSGPGSVEDFLHLGQE